MICPGGLVLNRESGRVAETGFMYFDVLHRSVVFVGPNGFQALYRLHAGCYPPEDGVFAVEERCRSLLLALFEEAYTASGRPGQSRPREPFVPPQGRGKV